MSVFESSKAQYFNTIFPDCYAQNYIISRICFLESTKARIGKYLPGYGRLRQSTGWLTAVLYHIFIFLMRIYFFPHSIKIHRSLNKKVTCADVSWWVSRNGLSDLWNFKLEIRIVFIKFRNVSELWNFKLDLRIVFIRFRNVFTQTIIGELICVFHLLKFAFFQMECVENNSKYMLEIKTYIRNLKRVMFLFMLT